MKQVLLVSTFHLLAIIAQAQERLPAWEKGYLDIHHISTGSGNAALIVAPDGTTLLIDAGDVNSPPRPSPVYLLTSPRLPHDSLSAARSISLYAKAVMPSLKSLDYALITHFHGDHMGVISSQSPMARSGTYRLNGITEVNEYLPIGQLFDRGYPLYKEPVTLQSFHYDTVTLNNYLRFVKQRAAKDASAVQQLRAGATDQLTLRYQRQHYPEFFIRNVKVNNLLWTGNGQDVQKIMPDEVAARDYNENPNSIALTIHYGNFDYFTGGDMTGIGGGAWPDWFDVETPVARVIGEVDALSLNHHGVRDATNEFFLKALQPRVIVQQSWSSNHPGEEVLHRLISPYVIACPRDIFATYVHQATLDTYGRWMKDNYKSLRGHVLIRVLPKGDTYFVYVLDDRDLALPMVKKFGPYTSR